jgi:hypothetical protein
VPAQYINLNLFVLTLLWIVLGLIAYWARKSSRRPGFGWVLLHAVAGPLMLPVMAWDYIQAGNAARVQVERGKQLRLARATTTTAGSAPKSSRAANVKARKKGRSAR